MATNIPAWMNESWHLTTMSGNIASNSITPNVIFDTSNLTISIQGVLWGTLDSSSVKAKATRVKGFTSSSTSPPNQRFHIDHTNRMLKCYLDKPTSRRRRRGALLSVAAGTLLGAAVYFVARSPFVGAAAGLIASTASFLIARFLKGGGSIPTWVANDPGSDIVGKPGP